MTAEIIPFPKKKKYDIILPENERQELLECGYDPDDPFDIDEYWRDLLEG